jgi:predicted AAA+ superfamily ATPase
LQQLIARYGLDKGHCALLNLEDPRLLRARSFEVLDQLVARFRERHQDVERLYFFLDEIQGIEGWERWLRSQLDRPQGNVFVVTGSNATLLSGEMASALTGRHLTVELFPFDLGELRRRDHGVTLGGYLEGGGFPAPTAMADGDWLLGEYFRDIVERDVRERLRARSSLAIRQVVQMAFESAGSEMSLRRIAAATGIAVDTAGAYLEASEAAYLLFGCPYFAFSERRRASRNKKYYPVDTGLRRIVASRTGEDRGKALECATYLALRRRCGEVYYWRDGAEVDFVVRPEGRIVPVQVTWDVPRERHRRALELFYEEFPQADEAVVVPAGRFETALAEI